MLGLITVLSMI